MKVISSLKTAQILFAINAAIWVVLSVLNLAHIQNTQQVPVYVQWVIAILIAGNAGAMALCGYLLPRKVRWYYNLIIVFLGINILLTVTDQVGIWDWITLAIDLVLLLLVFTLRKETP